MVRVTIELFFVAYSDYRTVFCLSVTIGLLSQVKMEKEVLNGVFNVVEILYRMVFLRKWRHIKI